MPGLLYSMGDLMARIEQVILETIIGNDKFARSVMPFIERDYFLEQQDKITFDLIRSYFVKYNKLPNTTTLLIDIDSLKLPEKDFDQTKTFIESLSAPSDKIEWLLDKTEKWCKDRAVYNAIVRSIQILDGKDKELSPDALPSLLQKAIAVSFDSSIGHDFFDDSVDRYDFYHRKEDRIRFGHNILNQITKNGTPRKTLNGVLAPTGVGKSLFLCDLAAWSIKLGYNVLYITLEMSQERVAERIDCNLMDISIDQLFFLSKNAFNSKIAAIRNQSNGKLVIKEYPTSSAHAGHFRSLLDELKTKKNFIPDLICIDYINICASQRLKSGTHNSYTIVKSIAEELRALAVEYNVAVWTATQTNRSGVGNSDISMTDTSESLGLPMTLDFLMALVRTEELDKLGQLMVIQLKSRYDDINKKRRFILGVDIQKFKLFELEEVAQKSLKDTSPVSLTSTIDNSKRSFDHFNF